MWQEFRENVYGVYCFVFLLCGFLKGFVVCSVRQRDSVDLLLLKGNST